MEKNLVEVNADADVDALIARIREEAKQSGTTIPVSSWRKWSRQNTFRAVQTQRLAQEIHRGGLSAEAINQIPLKRRGTKSFELRVKKFLKWLVHWNTKAQADFNQSVTRSLDCIANNFQVSQSNFETTEDLLRGLEERNERSINLLRTRIEHEAGIFDEKLLNLEEQGAQSSQQLAALISALSAIPDEIERKMETTMAARSSELERRISQALDEIRLNTKHEFEAAVERLSGGTKEPLPDQASRLEGKLDQALDEIRMRVLRAERSAKDANRKVDRSTDTKSSEYASEAQPNIRKQGTNGTQKGGEGILPVGEELPGQEFDYFMFELRHRGPVSEIKRRQSNYVDLFRGKANVVDLGCGRGEFVELLYENGINVTGVDSNQDMVDFCQERGLRVVRSDIFDYLKSSPDATFDGIFLSQVVEHLQPDQILRLVGLCARKLEPSGVIVVETVNTNCSAALSNFYLDPTHVRPVPAEMLRFMLEQASFQVPYLRFSSPLPESDVSDILDLTSGLNHEAVIYQDYAVVGFRC